MQQLPSNMYRSISRFPGIRFFQPRRLSSRRFLTVQHFPTGPQHTFWKTTLALGATSATLGYFAWQQRLIGNDTGPSEEDASVQIDNAVSPFPTRLGPPEFPFTTNYTLLGFGARSVTFINFKVYALGIYVASEDLGLIPEILSTSYMSNAFLDTDISNSHAENIELALKDPTKSRALINNLIDGGVRMMAKITPIRNTDFNHLKDGLIKSILNHPDAKINQEAVSSGIQELRDAFTRKGSVPKNDDLLIELQINGSLQLFYASRKSNEKFLLGSIEEPMIGRLLFSQYLSGKKPLSPATRDSFVSRVKTLV
ncbi:LADA_0A08152g1_1 [Lachancea dasiensis]|uniref:Altered inheritance of mitochondria protein 18, mitochondrial n=1 Tax=Lachancea dasiensis TaxID=1072105 RepID=A0A1G4IQ31_9SACH|nr:LADA_0A08152g1_1 [Lachancea dasiensis]